MFTALMLEGTSVPAIGRISARRCETRDTWTLSIDTRGIGVDGVAFEPGQFNMLYAFGIGEIPVSLSGNPATRGHLTYTVRAVGSASQAIARLRPGDPIGMRGPFGTAWPIRESIGADVFVIAGGLGLAPLRPAIYQLLAERDRYGQITLLYGTRSPADILFRREIERWRRRRGMTIEVTVDHADVAWHGHVGVLTKLIERIVVNPDHAVALVCGPEIMMRFAASALQTAGIKPESIHLSLERNMKCAIGQCGRCQFGSNLLCRDGAVMRYDRVRPLLTVREL